MRDKNDKEDLERIQFINIEEMAKKLKSLAKTQDPDKRYVDIFMQLPFKQVHVQLGKKTLWNRISVIGNNVKNTLIKKSLILSYVKEYFRIQAHVIYENLHKLHSLFMRCLWDILFRY